MKNWNVAGMLVALIIGISGCFLLCNDALAQEPMDLTGIWETDPTPYIIEDHEAYPEGDAFPDGHAHWLRRTIQTRLLVTHTIDEGYVFGTLAWRASVPGQDPLYDGYFKVLGTFEEGNIARKLLMTSSVSEISGVKLLIRLMMTDANTMHGYITSVSGRPLAIHATFHRKTKITHEFKLTDQNKAEHNVIRAHMGDVIDLVLLEGITLKMVSMNGVADEYNHGNTRQLTKGSRSYLIRHPGTVVFVSDELPDFKLTIEAGEDPVTLGMPPLEEWPWNSPEGAPPGLTWIEKRLCGVSCG